MNRVLTHYNVKGDAFVVLNEQTGKASHLPTEQPIRLDELLTTYVECQEPATRAQIRALAAHNDCPPHKAELERLLEEDTYRQDILHSRVSMLDLLEDYPSCELPFASFIALLPPLKARYYSISSSSKVADNRVSITVSVVKSQAWSGKGEYQGVASTYLAQRDPGDKAACFVSTPQSNFQLPDEPDTPMILVGPGTGIAPFRGFIQARRHLLEQGVSLGEAHLYFGCRHPEEDFLYENELKQAEQEGLIKLHTAFSRRKAGEKTYVQDLMKHDADTLLTLLEQGGRLYICGDGSKMAPDVTQALIESYQQRCQTDYETAATWLERLEESGQLAKDVWASH